MFVIKKGTNGSATIFHKDGFVESFPVHFDQDKVFQHAEVTHALNDHNVVEVINSKEFRNDIEKIHYWIPC